MATSSFVACVRTRPWRRPRSFSILRPTTSAKRGQLANQCGVLDILTKPSPPKKTLATVQAVFASRVAAEGPADLPDRDSFNRAQVRLLSSTLQSRVERLAASEQRLSAVVDLTQQIAAERDPVALLKNVCEEARQVTLAQHAITTLIAESADRSRPRCSPAVSMTRRRSVCGRPRSTAQSSRRL